MDDPPQPSSPTSIINHRLHRKPSLPPGTNGQQAQILSKPRYITRPDPIYSSSFRSLIIPTTAKTPNSSNSTLSHPPTSNTAKSTNQPNRTNLPCHPINQPNQINNNKDSKNEKGITMPDPPKQNGNTPPKPPPVKPPYGPPPFPPPDRPPPPVPGPPPPEKGKGKEG